MKSDRLDEIERAGYLAAKNSEAKSAHMYGPREERMAFEKGYYKGVIEINRAQEAEKEKRRCEKAMTGGMDL